MPDDLFFRRTDSEVAGPPREITGARRRAGW